jgi:tetratricopeptide (TPR) repeat protein
LNIGLAYLYLKRYQQAVTLYSQMIDDNPSDAEALVNRGVAWHYLDDKTAACEDWKMASLMGSEKAGNYLLKYCE